MQLKDMSPLPMPSQITIAEGTTLGIVDTEKDRLEQLTEAEAARFATAYKLPKSDIMMLRSLARIHGF